MQKQLLHSIVPIVVNVPPGCGKTLLMERATHVESSVFELRPFIGSR